MELIKKSLDYYDNEVNIITNTNFSMDTTKKIIKFFNNGKSEYYTYDEIGTYNNKSKKWAWSWANPLNNKNDIIESIKILNYGLIIDPIDKNNIYLKSELLSSYINIKNIITLEKYFSLICYLTKKKYCIIMIDENIVEFTKINIANDFILSFYVLTIQKKNEN